MRPKAIPRLTHERLLELLYYSIVSGKFYWLVGRPGVKAGSQAGGINVKGYMQTSVANEKLLMHRLAYFYLYGEWPDETIDHINRVKHHNHWINLRTASWEESIRNRLVNRENKASLLPGVQIIKGKNKNTIFAQINIDYKHIYLGSFSTEQEAHEAYKEASLRHFGEFSPFYKSSR